MAKRLPMTMAVVEAAPSLRQDWHRPRLRWPALLGVTLAHAGVFAAVVQLTVPLHVPTAQSAPVTVDFRMVEAPTPQAESPPPKVAPPVPQPVLIAAARPEPAPINAPVVEEPPPPAPEPLPVQAAPTEPPPVTPPMFVAAYLNNPRPAYPAVSKRLRETGRVLLRVLVSPQGEAEQVDLHQSSGSGHLDQSALETVRRWKFVPARQGDTAIAAHVIVPIDFQLRK